MGGCWLSQVSSNRMFQKLSVSSQNFDDFTHRALITWNKKGISGKRQLLTKTGATPSGLGQGPGFKGAPRKRACDYCSPGPEGAEKSLRQQD